MDLLLDPDPACARQFGRDGVFLLWRRDAPVTEPRQGVVFTVAACPDPECPCRNVQVDGYLVDDRLSAVRGSGRAIDLVFLDERTGIRRAGGHVVQGEIDIDTGVVVAWRSVAPRGGRMAQGLLAAELDGELLAHLSACRCRGKSVDPFQIALDRIVAKWQPGMTVAWKDVFPNDRDDAYVLEGRRIIALDAYGIDPETEPSHVRVSFLEDGMELGSVEVSTEDVHAIAYRHVLSREVAFVERLWACFRRRHRVREHVLGRLAKMREVGAEAKLRATKVVVPAPTSAPRMLVASSTASTRAMPAPVQGTPPQKVGRNDPCPCESGQKFKKCCLGKDASS